MARRKTKPKTKRERQRTASSPTRQWVLWGGVALAVAVVFGIIVATQSGAGGSGASFRMVAYQGQDILGGDEVEFSQVFRHGKPVILNFWAGDCPPSRAEMPGFQRVYEDMGDSYIMVGVDIGPFVNLGPHAAARQFLKEFDFIYPTGYAVSRNPVRDYNVQSMPTTLFLTPDGQVFDKRIGFLPEDQLRSKLQDLLASSS